MGLINFFKQLIDRIDTRYENWWVNRYVPDWETSLERAREESRRGETIPHEEAFKILRSRFNSMAC